MIALGIPTCRRPDAFAECAAAVQRLCQVDYICVHVDALRAEHEESYLDTLAQHGWTASLNYSEPRGSEGSKNMLLQDMLDRGADWMFLCEDDVRVRSRRAITGYLAAAEQSGLEHFCWHGGNPHNRLRDTNGPVSLWEGYVGCWTVYSRRSLEVVGLLDDQHFHNGMGHVYHTVRMAQAGFTEPRAWHVADATGSEHWLSNIPMGRSAATSEEKRIQRGVEWWRTHDPATFLWPKM